MWHDELNVKLVNYNMSGCGISAELNKTNYKSIYVIVIGISNCSLQPLDQIYVLFLMKRIIKLLGGNVW